MAMDFLSLTNELLREYNEVELTQDNFDDAIGVHARAKDCINNAIRDINTHHHKWPFNAVEHSQTLTKGTYEYAWQSDFKSAEWNSFQIQKDDSLNVSNTTLRVVERDEWYEHYKDLDDQDTTNGRSLPKYVFRTHGNGFGITPNPDQAYTLKYRYYKYSTPLSAYDDTSNIPEQFRHVVLLGASKHLARMLDGNQYGADIRENEFKMQLQYMRTLLINDDQYMRGTAINFGHRRARYIGDYYV